MKKILPESDNEEEHLYDYFHQTIGYSGKPMYICVYKNHVYYRVFRLLELNKKQKTGEIDYYDSVTLQLVNEKIKKQLQKEFEVLEEDVDLFKYCNNYALLDIVKISETTKQEQESFQELTKYEYGFIHQDMKKKNKMAIIK